MKWVGLSQMSEEISKLSADLCSGVDEKLQVIGVVKNEGEAALWWASDSCHRYCLARTFPDASLQFL